VSTHAHMETSDDGMTVTAFADCACGWRGADHVTDKYGPPILDTWTLAVVDRNIHRNSTHAQETA
jgi:hypothetical protein